MPEITVNITPAPAINSNISTNAVTANVTTNEIDVTIAERGPQGPPGTGGGGTDLPTEHVRITFNPSSRVVTNAQYTVTGTIVVDAPFTFVGTGSEGNTGAETLVVTDGSGTVVPVTHSSLTSNTFTFTVTPTQSHNVQNFHATANVTASFNNTRYSKTETGTFRITASILPWYSAQVTTIPASLSGNQFTNNGEFESGEQATFTANETGGRSVYIMLPTRSGGYTFRSGTYYLTQRTFSQNLFNNYTLYSLPDLADGTGAAGTYIITITEA